MLCKLSDNYTQVLAKKLPTGEQLTSLVDVLMEGLTDAQSLCSNGACVVLNGIAKLRGAELEHKVCTPLGILKLPIIKLLGT